MRVEAKTRLYPKATRAMTDPTVRPETRIWTRSVMGRGRSRGGAGHVTKSVTVGSAAPHQWILHSLDKVPSGFLVHCVPQPWLRTVFMTSGWDRWLPASVGRTSWVGPAGKRAKSVVHSWPSWYDGVVAAGPDLRSRVTMIMSSGVFETCRSDVKL